MCRLRLKKRSRGEKDWGVKGWIGLKEKEEQAETFVNAFPLFAIRMRLNHTVQISQIYLSIYLAALSHSPFLSLTNGGPFFVFPCSLWLDDHTVIRAPLWSGKHVCQLMILSNQALLVQPLTKNIFKVALKSVPVPRVMWTTALCGRNWVAWALCSVELAGKAEIRAAACISVLYLYLNQYSYRAVHESAGVFRFGMPSPSLSLYVHKVCCFHSFNIVSRP